MIDFPLTDEHLMLEQTVREWAGREVAPRIGELPPYRVAAAARG